MSTQYKISITKVSEDEVPGKEYVQRYSSEAYKDILKNWESETDGHRYMSADEKKQKGYPEQFHYIDGLRTVKENQTIYEQIVPELNLKVVIGAVNGGIPDAK